MNTKRKNQNVKSGHPLTQDEYDLIAQLTAKRIEREFISAVTRRSIQTIKRVEKSSSFEDYKTIVASNSSRRKHRVSLPTWTMTAIEPPLLQECDKPTTIFLPCDLTPPGRNSA